ncbi:PDZ domain-containing protein [Sediminibacterium soli]|uniref:PDZ domain-containing protein n=1 Tax=Sediminibacterium soli TaxID=2698829 RepID=UPI00137B8887|nr:PDZ domain-containing protein [Sediminibacterium soli]NCI47591.1 PDZ domain-containing protein [Sediminibacterium soli]
MYKKLIPAAALAFCVSVAATAQTREKTEKLPKKEKEESITIRKKPGAKEKTTIVIDGDEITVNGKPLSELKDSDVEVLRNHAGPDAPIFGRMAPMGGGAKMFGNGFAFGNKAVLGVNSKKDEKGARIVSVEKESAAEKAGLKQDDIITRVGDTKISGSDDLYEAIGKHDPEDKVSITYLRDGKETTASATLGRNRTNGRVFNFNSNDLEPNFNFNMPPLRGLEDMEWNGLRKPRLGMTIQDVPEGKGVKITDVDDASAAEKAGLKKEDLITDINGKIISSVDELKNNIRDLKEGDSVKVTYQRAGKSQTATISFPRKLKMAEL